MRKNFFILSSVIIICLSSAFAEPCPAPTQFRFIDHSYYDPDPYWNRIAYEIQPPSGWKIKKIYPDTQDMMPTTTLNLLSAIYVAKDNPENQPGLGLFCFYNYPIHYNSYGNVDVVPVDSNHFQESDFINRPGWRVSVTKDSRWYYCHADLPDTCDFK